MNSKPLNALFSRLSLDPEVISFFGGLAIGLCVFVYVIAFNLKELINPSKLSQMAIHVPLWLMLINIGIRLPFNKNQKSKFSSVVLKISACIAGTLLGYGIIIIPMAAYLIF